MNVKQSEILYIGTANLGQWTSTVSGCFGQTLGHISANKSVNHEITNKIILSVTLQVTR